MVANSISFHMSNMNKAHAPTNPLACKQNPVIEHSNPDAYSRNSHAIQFPPLGNTSDMVVFNDQPKPNMRNTMINCVEHVDLHVSNECSRDPRSNNEALKNFMVAPTLPHIMNMDGSNTANEVPLNTPIPNPSSTEEEKLKPLHLEGGPPPQRKSTFFQATLNCVSMLLGLGILSSPFAVARAGWMGAIISLLISWSYGYAACLMAKCVHFNSRDMKMNNWGAGGSYEEVARAAFGKRAEHFITALFYMEITGTLVGYCISVGDNLAYIFPGGGSHLASLLPGLTTRNFMMFLAAIVILPTVWLRDLSALSFTSMWCILTTSCLLLAVLLAATVDGHIGFSHPIPFLRLSGIPVAAGLYAFSFGGTSVFPSIYMSMEDPSKFTTVIVASFSIVTSCMVGLGIAGAYMFGNGTSSQVTLNMPAHLVTSKIILWMTVLTPMLKFALQLSPITTALEFQLYQRWKTSKTSMLYAVSTLIRSLALALIVVLAMVFPYFEYIVAFVGSSMTISICMIFPCTFYLKFYWGQLKMRSAIMIILLVVAGIIVGVCGTIISVQGLIAKRSDTSN